MGEMASFGVLDVRSAQERRHPSQTVWATAHSPRSSHVAAPGR